jgi:hypothetical protein
MAPQYKEDLEDESQTSEEVDDEVPQDDAVNPEDQEKIGDREEADGKPMTMEERRAKMQQLRAKMVRHISLTSSVTVYSTTACSGRPPSRTGPL